MQTSLRVVIIGASAALSFPGAAEAAAFRDRVISRAGPTARAAQIQGVTKRWPAAETTIPVTVASSFKGDPNVAGTYAAFIGTLPHGSEIDSLKLAVVPAAEINGDCGGQDGDGILACYSGDDQTMIIPGDPPPDSTVSVDYVIAHEYGHHIARHRSNAPLSALDFGPKRWSSYELVCDKADDNKVMPGDEGQNYAYNPGEAWAETYARLVFPEQAWRLAPVLAPDKGAYLAAAADVFQPWTRRTSTTLSGSGTKTFRLPVTLDGAFTLQASRTPAQIVVKSGSQLAERAVGRKRIHYSIACRDKGTETLRITVKATGRYTLKATYAG
ncbi:hypothetical protein [Candidatus Solirubrobacter pratensis]|uniref:hypothetical protein n=1 Tax=Candidatus Solirubrobacter pratensis TaxID=1298857 RepID=UPI0004817913|nr:hypothetical protein [Candidatus Solirubrobacter pratensis]